MRWTKVGAVLVVTLVATTCSEPTQPTPAGQLPAVQISLRPQGDIQVNEQAMLVVEAVDKLGRSVPPPTTSTFFSSDPDIVVVTTDGVVRGVRRGQATIQVTSGDLKTSVTIRVTARLRILPDLVNSGFLMVVGDSIQLGAVYIDVNGFRLGDAPLVSWQSSDPSALNIDAKGLAVATGAMTNVMISATVAEVKASVFVSVVPAEAGTAIIHLAHAARDLGAIHFDMNKGSAVSLKYGESIEFAVRPGAYFLSTVGMPDTVSKAVLRSISAAVHPGERLSVYVVGGGSVASLVALWDDNHSVDSEHGRVRLIQGNNFASVVYLENPGIVRGGLPELCYFDPWNASDYFTRTAGAFELALVEKTTPESGAVRLPANVPAGKSITLVLTGSTRSDIGYLAFTDQ